MINQKVEMLKYQINKENLSKPKKIDDKYIIKPVKIKCGGKDIVDKLNKKIN